jgi:hypothetical protein
MDSGIEQVGITSDVGQVINHLSSSISHFALVILLRRHISIESGAVDKSVDLIPLPPANSDSLWLTQIG